MRRSAIRPDAGRGIVPRMDEGKREDPAASPDAAPAPVANTLALAKPPEPVVDDLGQPIPARAFDPSLGEETREFGTARPLPRVCTWCEAPLPDGDPATCPKCGAALKPVDENLAILGVTVAPVDVRAVQAATTEALAAVVQSVPNRVVAGSEAGVSPPSPEVLRAMRLMELEALGVTLPDAADAATAPDRPAVAGVGEEAGQPAAPDVPKSGSQAGGSPG
jgi:hypothetical protein